MRTGALISLGRDTAEMEELCRSADIELLYEVVQRRPHPDRAYFIGKGRYGALKEVLRERPVDVLVINGDLRPSQHFNLESGLKVECLDRNAVVLDIFTSRAEGQEARLQVELARLRYQVPMMREWVHSAKAGEHPGFLGGGEYAVDVYYNLIRRRIARIEAGLRGLAKDGDLRRGVRRYKGFRTVCLAGYTNAGKSSLMERMTGEEVLIADRMFSTLDTTTRRMGSSKVLLTDTIGFLRDLPPFLLESFRNTLQDVFTADLVVLVVDSSEPVPVIEDKVMAVRDVLGRGLMAGELVVALNKIDQGRDDLAEVMVMVRDALEPMCAIGVSALTGEGIDALIAIIDSYFRPPIMVNLTMRNDAEAASEVSWLYDSFFVESVEYGDDVKVAFRCASDEVNQVVERLRSMPGTKWVSTTTNLVDDS